MSKQLNIPTTATAPLISFSDLSQILKEKFELNLDELSGKKVVFSKANTCQYSLGWESEIKELKIEDFSESSESRTVASLDSSCITLAELDDGRICAAKVALVFFQDRHLLGHVRFGPFISYHRQSTPTGLQNFLPISERRSELALLERSIAERAVRISMENLVALYVTKSYPGSILLLDGSLQKPFFENGRPTLKNVLISAQANSVAVLGISKSTNLKPLNRLSSVLFRSGRAPVYTDVHNIVREVSDATFGRVLLVRFSMDGLSYRVDVTEDCVAECSRLLATLNANDLFCRGYPEGLRLAHHLSVFTQSEGVCLRSHLLSKLRVVEAAWEDSRHYTLGRIFAPNIFRGVAL